MVMDAQPSPQSVGREFVRQYYTLLNKAPDHLHRFYNNSSSFLHGGLDAKSLEATLVVGQKQIHSKIQQLNFRDCHAKISQVDSQATLGNGVVVQVTGELSNDGQPMRRFTQTFVLAAQSPKKYYVHNDIFRYQDLYSDEELDDTCERANGEEEAVHQLVNDGTDAVLVLGDTKLVGATTHNVASSLVNVGVHQHHPQHQVSSSHTAQNTQQQPQLFYPANVINSSSVVLPAAYGAPSAAQTQTTSQQQHLNGLHDNMLKSVPTADSVASTGVSLLSSTNIEHGNVSTGSSTLKSVADQSNVSVHSHLSQTVASSQHQPLQSLTQIQASTANQLGISQQHQNRHQLSSLNDSDAVKSSLTSSDLNSVSTMAGSVSSAHVDTTATALQNASLLDRNATDLDKQQQKQHKPLQHQQHSHSQQQQTHQQHQKPQTSGSSMFGKQQQPTSVSLEPKTYANLVKSGVSASSPMSFASTMQSSLNTHNQQQHGSQSSGGSSSHPQQHQQSQHQSYNANSVGGNSRQQRDILSPPPVVAASNASNGGGLSSNVVGVSSKYGSDRQDDRIGTGLSGSGTGMSQQRSQQLRPLRSNGTNSSSLSGTGGGSMRQQEGRQSSYSRQNYDSEDRRQGAPSQFGDNHQLFLGNIPHHATEDELRTLFSKFGTVVDLRILSKSVQKMPGVRTPPHYGFITYEDPSSVQTCLSNMPLFFPENSPDGQKLNVEEKKTRIRGPGEGSGRINNNAGGLGGNSSNANGPRSGGNNAGQSRPSGGQGGAGSNRGSGGPSQRSIASGNGGIGSGGNRGSGGSGGYGQRSERGNVGNTQRSIGNSSNISNRGFGTGF